MPKVKRINPGMVDQIIQDRDPGYGGVWSILSGIPGCGKTNAIIRIMKQALDQYDDRLIWRGTRDCEWMRFQQARTGVVPVKIWLHQNVEIKAMINRTQEKRVELEDVVEEIERFRTYRELVEGIGDTPDTVNVVYLRPFHDHKTQAANQWLKFFHALIERVWAATVTLAFDEIEDFAPLNDSRMNTISAKLADVLKAMRKNDIHGLGATHQESQVDWRVLTKIPYSIYMQRAIVNSKRVPNNLNFAKINNLEPGAAVAVGKNWQDMTFKFEGVPDKHILRIGYET